VLITKIEVKSARGTPRFPHDPGHSCGVVTLLAEQTDSYLQQLCSMRFLPFSHLRCGAIRHGVLPPVLRNSWGSAAETPSRVLDGNSKGPWAWSSATPAIPKDWRKHSVTYRTTPKMAKRKEAHRAKLLQIAIRLFGKQGYHATTVPRIVRESGSSTGAFYFYFRNKDDIFACALQAIGEQIAGLLNKAMARAGGDTISQMRVAVETFVLYLAEYADEARILIVESSGLGAKLANVRRSI